MANIYGYICVSTKDQNEQRQLHKMMERGVEARLILCRNLLSVYLS